MLIASSDSYATVEPCGTCPLLDPLFSSESMTIEHDADHALAPPQGRVAGRRAPGADPAPEGLLRREPPGQLRPLPEVPADDGGLQAAGALERATQFPAEIDLERWTSAIRHPNARWDWDELADALGEADPLAGAIRKRLDETRLRDPSQLREPSRAPRASHSARSALSSARATRVCSGAPLGLVRTVDGERHGYGVGAIPAGELAGELGALHGRPEPGSSRSGSRATASS